VVGTRPSVTRRWHIVADKSSLLEPPAGSSVDQPTAIHNVVPVGHTGAGKTTLAESLLAPTRDDQPGRSG
jgi:Flp pilus assembly CpaF family ATPase